MSDNTLQAIFITLVFLWLVLVVGEPDLLDRINKPMIEPVTAEDFHNMIKQEVKRACK